MQGNMNLKHTEPQGGHQTFLYPDTLTSISVLSADVKLKRNGTSGSNCCPDHKFSL